MFSQRGCSHQAPTPNMNFARCRTCWPACHSSERYRFRCWARRKIKKFALIINGDQAIRYPVPWAVSRGQRRRRRRQPVAWGYARAADDLGVDIIQNCEVTGLRRNGRRIVGLETSRGFIKTRKVGCVVAGHSSVDCRYGRHPPAAGKPPAAGAGYRKPIKPIRDV